MGLLGWIVGVGIVHHLIILGKKSASKAVEERAEQERRRNTPCRFIDGFSEYEFEQMVKRTGKNIRRLTEVSINGPIVYGTVRSQSGISEWSFEHED